MIWKNLKYFTENEKWGKAERMNPALLLLLDRLREKVGRPFVIHCGYEEGGHASGSRHYKGDAADFHIEGMKFPEAVDSLLKALHGTEILGQVSAAYVGLGIYPDWNTPGFHLDIRGYSARWGRIGGEYVSFEKAYKHAGGGK
ncbi:MAG: D-Ala-D-Ala carboxypeptidase family metallohydrolase [Geovibrio sp.]|uniref:D-Ala-D-Ala carboxypeptidase family metallohydrolase n=1 Tax=Geovibrio ferrireducens TaxID=46201 RepID=UPI002246018C|nr:D-Ala-D-Ala carboxypeptidase family metallohydrolase [Geovibrio ferrireducens]MCD8568847.1 D-Ala-D-Ala carboxypeptidase family metallohydrolase [Geovibrio sp.]